MWLLRETDANNNIAIPVNRRNRQLAGTTRHVSLLENTMPLCCLNAICSAAGDTLFGGEYLCQDSRCFRRDECGMFGKGRYRSTCRTVLCETISCVVREDTTFPLCQTLYLSGHSLLHHFRRRDTYHGAVSRSVFKRRHLMASPALSVTVRTKQQTLSRSKRATLRARSHALRQ